MLGWGMLGDLVWRSSEELQMQVAVRKDGVSSYLFFFSFFSGRFSAGILDEMFGRYVGKALTGGLTSCL